MNDQKNVLLAIVLSAIVLIGWQYFIGVPQMERQRQEAQQKAATRRRPATRRAGARHARAKRTPQVPGQVAVPTPAAPVTRAGAIAVSPRIAIETPRLKGSIALKGARIDDLLLTQYRETIDPEVAGRHVAVAIRQPAPVLCRVRMVRCHRYNCEAAHVGHGLAAGGIGCRWKSAVR